MPTNVVVNPLVAREMLCARVTNTIMLVDGALTIEKEVDKPMVSSLKGVGLNMATFPQETLYLLQDKVT